MASIKARKILQSLTALTQIHCVGDSTANINLTKSRILTCSDYYPLRNLRSCDSVYTLQIPAFLLMKAIVAAREAIEEAKKNAKEQRKQSKIKRQEAAIL